MTYILSLATASPSYRFQQEYIAERMLEKLNLPPEQHEVLRKLYRNTAIHTRHSVMKDSDFLFSDPSANERNDVYKTEAPKLAVAAAKKAIDRWKGPHDSITHVISVSCTGMMAPGIDYHLVNKLGLSANVRRLGVNFMGCFGAFSGLAVAKSIARENVKHRILLVCTELCSLHGQFDLSNDSLLGNALFADGAAACVLGGEKDEEYLWEIVDQSSFLLENSHQFMSWEVAKSGYSMKLSPKVPILIKKNIKPFVEKMLDEKITFEECQWAIHPGGKDILNVIEKECALLPWQTDCSWQTLKDFGNMSSATFLFVLERLLEKRLKWTLGLAFGPGLAMEGILLRS